MSQAIREMVFAIDPTTIKLESKFCSPVIWVGYTGHGYGATVVANGKYRLALSGNSSHGLGSPVLTLGKEGGCNFYVTHEALQKHLTYHHDDETLAAVYNQLVSFVGFYNPALLVEVMEATNDRAKSEGKETLQAQLRELLGVE